MAASKGSARELWTSGRKTWGVFGRRGEVQQSRGLFGGVEGERLLAGAGLRPVVGGQSWSWHLTLTPLLWPHRLGSLQAQEKGGIQFQLTPYKSGVRQLHVTLTGSQLPPIKGWKQLEVAPRPGGS